MNDERIETSNAIIEDAVLHIEDHQILTLSLTLNYGDSCQGFGGYSLHLPKSYKHYKKMGCAGEFIMRVLEIADVRDFADLKGRTIRAKHNHCQVYSIGHIVKNDWFTPDNDLKE